MRLRISDTIFVPLQLIRPDLTDAQDKRIGSAQGFGDRAKRLEFA
jgi:hypothetical protein